jgi:spore maturation protein SpmB
MTNARFWPLLGDCFRAGLRKGGRSALWLLKIMLPFSLAMELLGWTGSLSAIAGAVAPVFHLFGLPGETAFAFLTSTVLSIYSGIAVLGTIPLTGRQVTILAMMVLTAHNLVVEGAVQKRSCAGGGWIVPLRLVGAVAIAIMLNAVMPADAREAVARGSAGASSPGFWPEMGAWGIGALWLSAKVILIVTGLMVLQQILDRFGLTRRMVGPLRPFLALLGLPPRAAFLWVVANTLGLAYGSAVIIDRIEAGELDREEARLLNLSIAICHSLLEDTLLWLALGAWVFWITVPRLVLAAAVVWGWRGWQAVRRRVGQAAAE